VATKRDYYEILTIERDASQQEIKSAYRRLAVKYHPDRNPGDAEAEERFKEAAEAYRVLADAETRARYDRFGHQGVAGSGAAGFDPDVFGDFADILGDFFGFGFSRRSRPGGPAPGADLRYELSITLEEAAFGSEKRLKVPRLETCETCSGSGSQSGELEQCSACGGLGQVRFTQGFFSVARACPQCSGRGQIVTDPCEDCDGDGLTERERVVEVRIPPGVDNGSRLRLQGEGEHGRREGPPGDLYVDIRVEEHEHFRREGPHVVDELWLSFPEAVLGTTLEVDTLQGPATLDIPPGTPHGKLFHLRGKGIPRLGGRGKGDHVVQTLIRVPDPRDLTEEQLELLRQLGELDGKTLGGDRKVLDRVRDLFH